MSAETLLEKVITSADELHFAVRAGDVVIAATDGLLDNLFQGHIQVNATTDRAAHAARALS